MQPRAAMKSLHMQPELAVSILDCCPSSSVPPHPVTTLPDNLHRANMADVATSTGADGPEGETPTQRQARLRREKRQKRMTEEGEDRLAKIKALNGGVAPPEEVLGGRACYVPRQHMYAKRKF